MNLGSASWIKLVAVVLAALVVMLPIASMPVSAQTITSVTASAARGTKIHGNDIFIPVDDSTSMLVITISLPSGATASGDDIASALELVLADGSSSPFGGTCQPSGKQVGPASFSCTRALVMPTGRVISFAVKLGPSRYPATGNLNLVSDNSAPSIQSIAFSESLTNRNEVELSYSIREEACTAAGCAGRCAGLKELWVYVSGSSGDLKHEVVDKPANSCLIEDTLALPIAGLSDGSYSICLGAADNVGNGGRMVTKKCDSLAVDRSAPTIAKLGLLDAATNAPLGMFIPKAGTAVKLEINFSTGLAPIASASADISAFGGPPALGLSCDSAGLCVSPQFTIALLSATSASIGIAVRDVLGNAADYTQVLTLEPDGTRPDVTALRTNYASVNATGGVVHYLGTKENYITADIAEEQAGFNNNNIWLKISDVSASSTVSSYDPVRGWQGDCSNAGAGLWSCEWYNFSVSGPQSTAARLTLSGADDTLNALGGRTEWQVWFDRDAPDIKSAEFKKLNPEEQYPALKGGDDVLLRVYFNERSGLKDAAGRQVVSADLRKLNGAPLWVPADDCSENATALWVCAWRINDIVLGQGAIDIKVNSTDIVGNGPALEEINRFAIVYTDPAGNEIRTDELSLTTAEAAERKDYWDVSVEQPPYPVDRLIANSRLEFSYSRLKFTKLRGSPKLLAVTLEKCEGDDYSNFINRTVLVPMLRNPDGTITDIYLESGVRGAFFGTALPTDRDYLQFNCTLFISSRVDGVTPPEQENLTVTIPLYNAPYGEISKGVYRKLKKLRENPVVKAEWMGDIQSVFDVMYAGCDIYYTLYSIATTLSGIGSTLPDWVPGASALQAIAAGITKVLGWVEGPLKLRFICRFFSCTPPQPGEKWCAAEEYFKAANVLNKKVAKYPRLKRAMPDLSILPQDPRENFISSILTCCIPGIFYQFTKWRQILCMKMGCLVDTTKTGGNIAYCDMLTDYLECAAVFGELFEFLGATLLKSISRAIVAFISNPVNWAVLLITEIACPTPPSQANSFCRLVSGLSEGYGLVIRMMAKVQAMKGAFDWKASDKCADVIPEVDELLKAQEEREEKEKVVCLLTR